jgi:hypothetical protein
LLENFSSLGKRVNIKAAVLKPKPGKAPYRFLVVRLFMLYTGLFKRIIPFVLTFAVGLFIASFFVSVAVPNFDGMRGSRHNRWKEKQRLQTEVHELRQKVHELECQNRKLRRQEADVDEFLHDAVPPVDIEAPPAPPRHSRHSHRTEIVR